MRIKSIVFITICFYGSCNLSNDFDYKSISTDIVINSILYNDSIITLSITKPTSFPGSNNNYDYVKNAEVILYEDSKYIGILDFCNESSNYTLDYYPIPDLIYRIEVYIPGKDVIWAETSIPSTFDINTCYDLNYQTNYNNNIAIKVGLSRLEPDESYWIHFYSEFFYRDFFSDSSYLIRNLISGLYTDYRFFDDFNASRDEGNFLYNTYLRTDHYNSELTFNVFSYENGWFSYNDIQGIEEGEKFRIFVSKTKNTTDNYWKAILLNYFNKSFEIPNPFFEPISFQSNIHNATGVFGAVNHQFHSISIGSCQ